MSTEYLRTITGCRMVLPNMKYPLTFAFIGVLVCFIVLSFSLTHGHSDTAIACEAKLYEFYFYTSNLNVIRLKHRVTARLTCL